MSGQWPTSWGEECLKRSNRYYFSRALIICFLAVIVLHSRGWERTPSSSFAYIRKHSLKHFPLAKNTYDSSFLPFLVGNMSAECCSALCRSSLAFHIAPSPDDETLPLPSLRLKVGLLRDMADNAASSEDAAVSMEDGGGGLATLVSNEEDEEDAAGGDSSPSLPPPFPTRTVSRLRSFCWPILFALEAHRGIGPSG